MSKNFRIMCKINEISGDLFSAPLQYSMAHCVAADMRLGKGIAVKFRDKFNQIPHLKSQNVKPGGVAFLKDKDRFIYYLVTKQLSFQKPTYETMHDSLKSMKEHMKENNVKKLAMPRIGCGLDGLHWSVVRNILQEIFKDEDVEITVYNFSPQK